MSESTRAPVQGPPAADNDQPKVHATPSVGNDKQPEGAAKPADAKATDQKS